MSYDMPLDEEGIRARLRDSLVDFSFSCLAIRTKTGAVGPFGFNRVQLFLHREIETQLHSTGNVRALVLKGRQLGCSPYVAARFLPSRRAQRRPKGVHPDAFGPGDAEFIQDR